MAERSKKKASRNAAPIIIILFFVVAALFITFTKDGDTNGEASAGSAASAAAVDGSQRPFGGDGYVMEFGPDFNVGLNSVDDLGLSVVIAMDLSGSMADPPDTGLKDAKYIQATRAIGQIVGFLEKNFSSAAAPGIKLRVGIIGFSDTVSDIFPLTTMDAAGFARLKQVLANPGVFEPQAKTAIGAALQRGSAILAQSGTILKSLIVVSDGLNNLEPEPVDVMKAINQNRNDASTIDFPVYTSGTLISFVGFDIASGSFADIEKEGARITSAADQSELQAALQQILVADITRLEAAGD